MRKYQIRFDQLRTGVEFHRGGYTYIKRSSRTAQIRKPEAYAGRWRYFAMRDLCVVTDLAALNHLV